MPGPAASGLNSPRAGVAPTPAGKSLQKPPDQIVQLVSFRLFHRRDVTFAEAIKSHRIVIEHFLFELVGQVFAPIEGRQVAAERIAQCRSPTVKAFEALASDVTLKLVRVTS